jgi:hypothetical protein
VRRTGEQLGDAVIILVVDDDNDDDDIEEEDEMDDDDNSGTSRPVVGVVTPLLRLFSLDVDDATTEVEDDNDDEGSVKDVLLLRLVDNGMVS